MSTLTPATNSTAISPDNKKQIVNILKDVVTTERAPSSWRSEVKAAFLAAWRLGLAIVADVKAKFHITSKMMAEWAKNKSVAAKRDSYFVAPTTT